MNQAPPTARGAGKVLTLFCLAFLLGGSAPATARPNQPEAGVSDSVFVRFPLSRLVQSSLAICITQFHPIDSDLGETYGAIQTYGLREKIRLRPQTELILGVAYGRERGDPYHSEDFQSRRWASMSLLPIELGIGFLPTGSGPRRESFGFIFSMVRIRERNPAFRYAVDQAIPEIVDWRLGFRAFIDHEWHWQESKRALGLELSLGSQRYLTYAGNYSPGPGSTSAYQWSLGFYLAKNGKSSELGEKR